jgi:enoyl-CoA hydratase/carnithine racemase
MDERGAVPRMTQERVRVEVSRHIATVALTRPDKHNALDAAMFAAIVEAAEEVARQPGIRAVVLHGEGPSFCSGIDLGSLMAAEDGLQSAVDELRGEVPNRFQRVAYDWVTLPFPVVAAVHGNCLGGGLQIALGADIRIDTPDDRFSVMEVKWGLIPDMSLTQTLPRLVGSDVAKELVFTGRVFSGEEALALGIVTRLADDPLAAAMQLAGEIAARSPDAVRGAKRLLDQTWNRAPEEGLSLEAEIQRTLIGSPNQLAAVVAGLRKEDPEFADPAAEPA